jgi:glycosidase
MTKSILRLPLVVSTCLAVLSAAIGFTVVSRFPGQEPGLGILKSPFQTGLRQKDSVIGSYPDLARTQDIASWSGYTGKLGNDILYYIFVDRFYDGDRSNNRGRINTAINGDPKTAQLEQQISRLTHDPNQRLFGLFFGGDLEGVRRKLPYLSDLGITKLVLSPIQEGAPGFTMIEGKDMYLDTGDGSRDKSIRVNMLANYHGYWIRDWFRLDPRMHSDANPDSHKTLRRLLDEANKYGIGIILDLTLHHTSPVFNQDPRSVKTQSYNVFPALGEVREKGLILANVNTAPEWYATPCQMDYGRPTVQMLTTCQIAYGLPTLNHHNPNVSDYLLRAAEFWLTINPGGAQVAGIRIDAIKHIDSNFIRDLVKLTRSINPNAVIFAEDFGGGSQTTSTYDILSSAGDVSTIDFSFSDSIRHYFSGDRSWTGNRVNLESSSLGEIYTQDLSTFTPNWFSNPGRVLIGTQNSKPLFPLNYPASKSWITSIETHDAPRLRTFRHEMTEDQYAAMIAFQFVARGVPMVNYGAEVGLSVPPLPRNNGLNGLGGDPFNRQMMVWPNESGFNKVLYNTTKFYAHLRRVNQVLRYGDTFFLRTTADLWWSRPLLMLRSYQSRPQKHGDKAFLFAYSPEGGSYEFLLPERIGLPSRVCEVEHARCISIGKDKRLNILLKPERHRVFELTF